MPIEIQHAQPTPGRNQLQSHREAQRMIVEALRARQRYV